MNRTFTCSLGGLVLLIIIVAIIFQVAATLAGAGSAPAGMA